MHTLCRYMGWPRGLYSQLVKKDQTKELEVVQAVQLKKQGRSFQEGGESQCSHVSLACDPSACGRRPLYVGIDQVPNDAVAAWPWTANLFVEDEQVQLGSLIIFKVCRCMHIFFVLWAGVRCYVSACQVHPDRVGVCNEGDGEGY